MVVSAEHVVVRPRLVGVYTGAQLHQQTARNFDLDADIVLASIGSRYQSISLIKLQFSCRSLG